MANVPTKRQTHTHPKIHCLELPHQFARLFPRSAKNRVQPFSKSALQEARQRMVYFINKGSLTPCQNKFLRLANFSPLSARSPARRSRDGRETTGKTSGAIFRVISAQRPGNSRAVATAMPPNVRRDDWQDNLPCSRLCRAMSAPETGEKTCLKSQP